MPRFVVLEHDHPELHWDFMLENAGVLKTWRLPEFPPVDGQKLAAQAIADHRLHYLDYEGPVSGNRGRVVRCDRGSYEVRGEATALVEDRIQLTLAGSRLCGIFALERQQGDAWQLWRVSSGQAE